MADLTLAIDRLGLTFDTGPGSAHRIRPIGSRAMVLLQTYVEQRMVEWGLSTTIELERLTVPPISIDISQLADEEIAHRLAEAIFAALMLNLRQGM